MTTHAFGSDWTAKKLGCVEDYAMAWSKIMDAKAQQFSWQTRYIDAFSGSGSYLPKLASVSLVDDLLDTPTEQAELRKGSAHIAIDMRPKFDRIDLIEMKPSHAAQLKIIAGDELGKRVFVHQADVNHSLSELCETLTRSIRALIFIDPYGCQVDWETLRAVAKSGVADVWYLIPTSGISRQLSADPDTIENYKRERLNRLLGTEGWRDEFYRPDRQLDLFRSGGTARTASSERIETFVVERLKTLFPAVHSQCLQLRHSKNALLFSLCFAMANPSQAAQTAALRIAKDVIRKWSSM